MNRIMRERLCECVCVRIICMWEPERCVTCWNVSFLRSQRFAHFVRIHIICWFAFAVLVNSTFTTEHFIRWEEKKTINELVLNANIYTWNGMRWTHRQWKNEAEGEIWNIAHFTRKFMHLRVFSRCLSISLFLPLSHTHIAQTHIIYGVELLIGVLTPNSMCVYVFAKGWAHACIPRVCDWLEHRSNREEIKSNSNYLTYTHIIVATIIIM